MTIWSPRLLRRPASARLNLAKFGSEGFKRSPFGSSNLSKASFCAIALLWHYTQNSLPAPDIFYCEVK